MNELVACVIGLAVGSSVNFAQAAAQVIDFYMREDRSKERAALIAACSAPDGDADAMERVRGYVREGMRLNPQFGGLFRVCVQDDVVPQGTGFADMQVKKGDWLFGSFKNAHLNVCSLSFSKMSLNNNTFLLSISAERLPEPHDCRPNTTQECLQPPRCRLPRLPWSRLRCTDASRGRPRRLPATWAAACSGSARLLR